MTTAIRYDTGKAQWHLLPTEAIEQVIKVMEFGAQKYDEHNWRKGFLWSRCFNSGLRHMMAWLKGEDNDPESGLSHIAHAATNMLFLMTYILEKSGQDNRYKALPVTEAPSVVGPNDATV